MARSLLLLTAFLLPFSEVLPEIFGINTVFRPYRVIGIAALALTFFRAFRRGQIRADIFHISYLAIFLWGLSIAFIRYMFGADINIGFLVSDSTLIVFGFAFGLAIRQETNTLQQVEQYLLAFTAGLLASLVTYHVLLDLPQIRFSGFYANPNSLAFACAIGIATLFSRMLTMPRFRTLPVLAIMACIGLLLVTLPQTGSRGGLVASGVGAAVCSFRLVRQRFWILLVVGAIAGVGLVKFAWPMVASPVQDRLEIDEWKDGSGRLDTWAGALKVSADHYYIGTGVAQYRTHSRAAISSLENVKDPRMRKKGVGLVAHSEYLGILAANGAPALALFVFALAIIYKRLWGRSTMAVTKDSFAPIALLGVLSALYVAQVAAGFHLAPEFYLVMSLACTAILARAQPITTAKNPAF